MKLPHLSKIERICLGAGEGHAEIIVVCGEGRFSNLHIQIPVEGMTREEVIDKAMEIRQNSSVS